MLLSARRLAFAAPLVVTLIVAATHLGFRNGLYRTSRPDSGRGGAIVGADGYVTLHDAVPVNTDASNMTRLATFFRGATSDAAAGSMDERPYAAFLAALLGAGVIGTLWSAIALNVLAWGASGACAVDLLLRLGRSPLAAAAFGCIVAGGRGAALYLGIPDAHALACAWVPIGAWLFERLNLESKDAPIAHALTFALAAGAAMTTYLGDIVLLGFIWLYGIGRTPIARLVLISALALALQASWVAIGRAGGLPFYMGATRGPFDGAREIASLAARALARPWWMAPFDPAKSSRLNDLYCWAKEIPTQTRPLAHVLVKALVPAFGWPLLIGGALGAFACTRRERRLALALFLVPVVTGWPMNAMFNAPRISYPGASGLALAAAIGLASAAAAIGARFGGKHRVALEVALVALAVVAFVAWESSDVFGSLDILVELHHGE